MWSKWNKVTLCLMKVKHVYSMSKVHEVWWFMCKIYEGYVNDECDVPSLREFIRSTMVEVVVWDATFIFH